LPADAGGFTVFPHSAGVFCGFSAGCRSRSVAVCGGDGRAGVPARLPFRSLLFCSFLGRFGAVFLRFSAVFSAVSGRFFAVFAVAFPLFFAVVFRGLLLWFWALFWGVFPPLPTRLKAKGQRSFGGRGERAEKRA